MPHISIQTSKESRVVVALVLVLLSLILWIWPYLPEMDSNTYFNFADHRNILGIPNALNVLTNIFFFISGFIGIKLSFKNRNRINKFQFTNYLLFSLAILFTSFGSSYFHLSPNSETLIWDRLPMSVAFSSLISMIIADRLSSKSGAWVLAILIPYGLFTVLGYGYHFISIRPYIFLQFGSILFVGLIIAFLKEEKISNSALWACLGFYTIAKIFEFLDSFVFDLTSIISGHSLKHFFAFLAVHKIIMTLREIK